MPKTSNSSFLIQTLTDQTHCYFLSDPPGTAGLRVSSIPFTHPNCVAHVLSILRQQALFNALVESLARVKSIQDVERSIMFEVSYTDLQHVSVTFEHPGDDCCICTVDLDLTGFETGGVSCTARTSSNVRLCPDNLIQTVLLR